MTECFDDLVVLREYCDPPSAYADAPVPYSGIYLNDIGLGKQQIESIITGDYASVKQIVDAAIRMAATEIASESYGYFSSQVTVKSAIESGVVGMPAENKLLVASTGNFEGIKIQLLNTANYMNMELKSVSLFINTTASVDILVYDLEQETLLDTFTVDAIAGERVELAVNKKYSSTLRPLRLWIGYDTTGIDHFKTLTRPSVCCGNYSRTTEYVKATGTSFTGSITNSGLTTLQETSGIGIRYSLHCNPYSWICSYSLLLALPIAHKAASEIYRRGLMVSPSVRSNNSTNTNSDLMAANMNWHLNKSNEILSNVLKNIHLPNDSVCFRCKSPVQHRVILP